MDANSVMYMIVEIAFFAIFVICFRDAWKRSRNGDIPLRVQEESKRTEAAEGKQRYEDQQHLWYIQPEDEWARLPVDGDSGRRQPGYLWICIMLAAMGFTFAFEYALTHRRAEPTASEAMQEKVAAARETLETSAGGAVTREAVANKLVVSADQVRAAEEGAQGSGAIYSYRVPAIVDVGAIVLPLNPAEPTDLRVEKISRWEGDGECVGFDIPRSGDRCEKAGSAIPLWIPCGWALIFYLVMRTSDKLALVWYKRPILDALLALVIDFALDPIASWNHWWLWDFSSQPHLTPTFFFKVPATNFMAWVVIVGSFSFLVRLFQRWRSGLMVPLRRRSPVDGFNRFASRLFSKLPRGFWGDLIVPTLAILPSFVVVIVYSNHARWLMTQRSTLTHGALLCSVVWAVLAIIVAKDAPTVRRDHAHDKVLMFSPIILYLIIIIALYTTKVPAGNLDGVEEGILIYQAMPEMVIMVPLAAIVGALIFAWPYSKPGPESWW